MDLKQLNKNQLNFGFTIVETMIFLVVSTAIFVSVSLLISEQLVKYQSRDAINNVESIIRGALNDVSNGYYPMVGYVFNCDEGDTKPSYSPPVVAGENRGENTECIIIGKAISFNEDNIQIDTYIANTNITKPITEDKLTVVSELNEVKDYKWQLKPTVGKTFYILNTNFDSTIAENGFISGSQNVALYKKEGADYTVINEDDRKICFDSGDYNSSLEFLTDGAVGVQINYKDDDC